MILKYTVALDLPKCSNELDKYFFGPEAKVVSVIFLHVHQTRNLYVKCTFIFRVILSLVNNSLKVSCGIKALRSDNQCS